MSEHDDDFMGESLPALTFKEIGDTHGGQILSVSKMVDRDPDGKTKEWPNGDPMHVWKMNLDTDEDGVEDAALWVRGNMVTALRDAMREAGLKPSDNPIVKVRYDSDGEAKKKGYNPPKLYKVRVTPGPKPAAKQHDEDAW
jgi:hypothetical protein